MTSAWRPCCPGRACAFALAALLSPLAATADIPMAPESDARCQVWARELGFAQSVADRDAAAFAAHLHPQAAFGVSGRATVGREAIVAEWAGIIDGSAVKLSWYPRVVTVAGNGDLAYSSGPALYEDPKTGAAQLGRFGSVWRRNGGGQWQVVFDDGIRPQPAVATAVAAFHAGHRSHCPGA
jgi:ketosteroid isomerase-like protein